MRRGLRALILAAVWAAAVATPAARADWSAFYAPSPAPAAEPAPRMAATSGVCIREILKAQLRHNIPDNLLLAIGLLTRLAAGGTTIILLVTVYFHWVILGQGYSGSELSLIWSAVTLVFLARGGGRYSVDRLIGMEL